MKPSVLSKSNLFLRFWIALAVVLAFGAVIRKINDFSKTPLQTTDGRTFVKAEVVEIVKDNADETGNRNGYQTVMLEILEGAHKGEKLEASSSSSYLYGTVCQVGMKVIAILSESPNEVYLSVYSFYRTPVLYVIILLFFLSIYLVGRKQGLRAIAGLVFTCFCIWYLFLLLVYQGYSPVWCAVFTCIVTTAVTIYFIGGISAKTVCAILGTVSGVCISGFLSLLFCRMARISGMNVSEIESLIYVRQETGIQIGELLHAGILIAALGAVMDVSMSVASTVWEIHEQNPALGAMVLFKSGMNVGRDVIGTMSNTLILAFAGGSINTLIFLYAYDYDYQQMMNMYSVGIEIIQGIASSMGVILAVPLVSAGMAFFCGRNSRKDSDDYT